MPKFVIDEDMPRSTGRSLVEQGHEVKDVRDHGYRGSSDVEIYRFAQEEGAIIVTGDLGFANILKFPLGKHFGIVVARFPNDMRPWEINKRIVDGLRDLTPNDFKGNLIILERKRIRIRRAPL